MNKRALLPNAVTTANILCGFYALVAVSEGQLLAAAWAVVAAGIFDLFDGRIARMVKGTSEFGEHFDTLSDLLSFGIAPGLLLYRFALRGLGPYAWIGAFLYTFAVAVRLARFSIKNRPARKNAFEGLSSPPAAATLSTFVLFANGTGLDPETGGMAMIALAAVLAALMVSRLTFPSFKETNWKSAQGRALLAVGAAGVVASVVKPSIYLFVCGMTFIATVLVMNACGTFRRTARE